VTAASVVAVALEGGDPVGDGSAIASQSSFDGRVKLYSRSSSTKVVPLPSSAVYSSRPSIVSPYATSSVCRTTVCPGWRVAPSSPAGVRVVASRTAYGLLPATTSTVSPPGRQLGPWVT